VYGELATYCRFRLILEFNLVPKCVVTKLETSTLNYITDFYYTIGQEAKSIVIYEFGQIPQCNNGFTQYSAKL